VTKGFAAGGALLGVNKLGAEPVASGFAMWIDTLNGGARHEGHTALSPWRPAHPCAVSFPWLPSFSSGEKRTCAKL
jgi:hypothetical protein